MTQNRCSWEHRLRICGTGNIGSKWQIVIPKEVRDILGIQAGDSMSFILKDEKILGIVPNNSIDTLMDYIATEKNINLIQ